MFPGRRLAVFVDGCFWHRCPDHGLDPQANADWWRSKLDRNVSRDRATDEELAAIGWTVVRVWEHEAAVDAADRIESLVRGASRSEGRDSAPSRAGAKDAHRQTKLVAASAHAATDQDFVDAIAWE